jgi:hypothetical protein
VIGFSRNPVSSLGRFCSVFVSWSNRAVFSSATPLMAQDTMRRAASGSKRKAAVANTSDPPTPPAKRAKMTARKSTGGKPPPKSAARKSAANDFAAGLYATLPNDHTHL